MTNAYGASPPGPPDRQGAGAGYGFEIFATQKSQNRGYYLSVYWLYRRYSPPGATRSGCKGEAPCPPEVICALCAQLPEPDCKSGRVAHEVCCPQGRQTRLPSKRQASPCDSPPAAGGASPPGPPDRQGAGAGYGFEFLRSKNCKTGGIIYLFIGSLSNSCHRVLPGRVARAKRLAHRR